MSKVASLGLLVLIFVVSGCASLGGPYISSLDGTKFEKLIGIWNGNNSSDPRSRYFSLTVLMKIQSVSDDGTISGKLFVDGHDATDHLKVWKAGLNARHIILEWVDQNTSFRGQITGANQIFGEFFGIRNTHILYFNREK